MNKRFIYMSLLSATLLLGSCKDEFLDQEPYSSLPIGSAILTADDMQSAANGMYQSLRSTDTFGRNIPLMGDLMADNVYIAPANSGRYIAQNAYTTTVATAEPANMWSALYTTILRANTIINATVPASPTVDQLKGEAYAVRALCYFELTKFFATPYTVNPNALGVPLVTTFDPKNPTSYYTGSNPKRNTVAEVYAQINADLDQAYSLITATKNSSYINKYGARALQARAYLYMGDYQKAKEAALDVVTNGGYTLVSAANYASYWKNAAPVTNKVETIFEISLDGVNNNGTNALAYIYDQNGYGDMLATTDLYNTYAEGDVRKSVITAGKKGTVNPAYIVAKYPNTLNASDKDDIKVIRYAEVLLTLAEAEARTGNPIEALRRLNEVATARGAAPYVSVGDQLIQDILTERRKELAFEGHRYWDFMRLNLPIIRTAQHPSAAREIAVDNFRRIQPIPQGELDANPNIEPNPGY
ncbi:RagB/SusD family nutrient uptake outer membrane protein [Pontibacter ruber]|uniref:RagB/SusD family nutrient uptake outer membrane protein n=1 Tax=Pontibacter ruber TaxID=1343895 RepID=A0ABW5CV41_9BACT|nr:RagB/SusD family nutrient uptake outer membrane protein [Pontibacter ruber]